MFKRDTLELTVIRTEGIALDPVSLGCYITVDGRLFDVITPLCGANEEVISELPLEGTIRLVIKCIKDNDYVVGTVSFPLSALPQEGFQWIPLFDPDSPSDDVTDFEIIVEPPKILL